MLRARSPATGFCAPFRAALRLSFFLTGLTVGLFGHGHAHAKDDEHPLPPALATAMVPAAQAPIRLVTGTDYPPYVDAHLPHHGVLSHIVKEAFAAAGLAVADMAVEPWQRTYEATVAQRYDAAFPYVPNAERRNEMLFSDPIITLSTRIFIAAHRREEAAAAGLGWLRGKKLCRGLGYGLLPWLQELVSKHGVVHIIPSQQSHCLAMVKAGHADFLAEDESIVRARMQRLNDMEALVPFPNHAPPSHGLHLIVARKNPRAESLIGAFNQGLASLRQSGRLEAIQTEHLGARLADHSREASPPLP
jgi:polar amino acid transport system substrate-binding protein